MDLTSGEDLPLRVNARHAGLATLLLEINVLLWRQPAGGRHRGSPLAVRHTGSARNSGQIHEGCG